MPIVEMERRQVVVIGAGPSGAIAAALLKRKGHDVLIIERQHFPRFSIGESLLSHCIDFIEEADATLKARKKAVQAEAEQRARAEIIPRYRLEMGKGKRKFSVSPTVVKMVTGIDPYTAPDVCTPAELIRRGASKTAGIRTTKKGKAQVAVEAKAIKATTSG